MSPSARPLTLALKCARAAAGCRQTRPADADLLARFAGARDGDAFAELVRRHGPLVLGVARRRLADRHAAEDVVQGTFLALARQAGRLRDDTVLPGWLHTVAFRLARKAQAAIGRRPVPRLPDDTAFPTADPLAQVSGCELVALIDAELARLPAPYRIPLILCGLEGLTRDEAASRLGWTVGALRGRLERGRALLRTRLAVRGLTVPAVLAGGLLATSAEAMPPSLVRAVTRAAIAVPAAAMPVKMLIVAAVVLTALGIGTGAALMPGGQSTPKTNPPVPMAAGPVSPQPRVDAEGMPLQPEALARLGSTRMRHANSITSITFAPNGGALAAADRGEIRLWDTASGRVTWTIPTGIEHGGTALGFSTDGRHVLCVSTERDGIFRRLDAATGEERQRVNLGKTVYPGGCVAPSGRHFAFGLTDQSVRVYDAATCRELHKLTGFNAFLRGLAFSADDRLLAVADYGDTIRLFDLATGAKVGEVRQDGARFAQVDLSPDGRVLVGCSDDGRSNYDAHLWDVGTGVYRGRLRPGGPKAFVVRFAPDGRSLAVADRFGEPVLLAADTRAELRRFSGGPGVYCLTFSPDGKSMAVAGGGFIALWDVASGRMLPASANPVANVDALRFTADARRVIGRADRHIVWDAVTGTEISRLPAVVAAPGRPTLSLDGRTLAGLDGAVLRIWDAASGTEVRRMHGDAIHSAEPPVFSPEGSRLIAAVDDRRIAVWDVATGRRLGEMDLTGPPFRLVVSPNGRHLIAISHGRVNQGDNTIRLWDLTTYREIGRFDPQHGEPYAAAFAPDGRWLATAVNSDGPLNRVSEVRVWDIESARFVRSFPHLKEWLNDIEVSPDGRMLFAASIGRLRLLEVASGTERHHFDGHTGLVHPVAVSPDGHTLAASSPDAPVYLWDVYGRFDPHQPPTAGDLNQCWTDLAAADAAVAFRSIRRLIAAPDAAIALFRERLKPAPPPDDNRVKQLIASLDSPKFADRQAAAKELGDVADRAAAQLRSALNAAKSAEVRQALQAILDRLDGASPETLRSFRSVEVLEQIGTPAAREHLKALAGGAAGATLTRAAAEALKRLGPTPVGP